MSLTPKIKVLLVLEGSYPFAGGGISTWTHQLTHEVSNASFVIYSINAHLETKSKYELSENVDEVIQVPIWAPNEPHDYINYGKKYYKLALQKELTTEKKIQKKFIPVFKELMNSIFNSDSVEAAELDKVFFNMWKFFNKHDFKKTMTSVSVWETYREAITTHVANEKFSYKISLLDLTIGLRWIYRFLIPFSIEIPKADISHITLSGFPVVPALTLKYKYKTPIMITEHGVFIRERLIAINSSEYSFFLKNFLIKFSECITKIAYYNADSILSVNTFNTTWEEVYGAAKDKIKIIYNGVDHNLFKPRPKPDHLKNVPTVVAAARIFELKDILTMIRTCNVVRKTIPNVKFLVYGSKNAVPEYTKKCENLIDELDLRANFELAGFHSDPHLIYNEGDISILTSISEGFPFTVIESMSSGVPVVSTDVGGVYEALDEKSGFICKPRDYDEIASKVVELLSDDKLRKEMSVYGRQRVIDYFTIGKFINGYEEAYKELYESDKSKKIEEIKKTQLITEITN
ncbi:DUF3492 domain-containing protein [Aureibaculum algae]|uniref:DUF3492 domain-containing protein n=1 Tax=Aureibaculum algae TaxID=2584122 RepID=A0A5B7U1P2_9FLAO|nr:GT4 family glycosyltransferase PelF [Aureibaculum algae]QCX40892.1 DUF3492 domain-containing protein [Aureibaculum algae]